jgi:formylglycine-generating enzyme required for sulfatase activity
MLHRAAADLNPPAVARTAGPEVLALALLEARSTTFAWLAAFEAAGAFVATTGAEGEPLPGGGVAGIVQTLLAAGGRPFEAGGAADADAATDPTASRAVNAADAAARARAALAEDIEAVQEALAAVSPEGAAAAPEEGAAAGALEPFRLRLWLEDRAAEWFAEVALAAQLPPAGLPWRGVPSIAAAREPVWLPPTRLRLGSEAGAAFVPAAERFAHEVPVPEFEIDALPVTWARWLEFAEDAGYDRDELWGEAGLAWREATGRRAPRHVLQQRGGAVVVQRAGRATRVALHEPVRHATRHEAEAFCRWAGRRLPTEPEWEAAALHAAARGFAFGAVWEWTAGRARAWPGADVAPATRADAPPADTAAHGVLRGGSFATPPRQRHAKARRFARLEEDAGLFGFRTCGG